MSGTWGERLELSIFGESHGKGIGIVINGMPVGYEIDYDYIRKDMKRRAPGKNKLSTPREEKDLFDILSGVFEDKISGAPIAAIIMNTNTKSKDYSNIQFNMRPGHGDYPGFIKYKGFNDYRGGGHFSGRITAPLVFAGSLAKQILKSKGINISAHISSIGDIEDENFDKLNLNESLVEKLRDKEFPVLDDKKGREMQEKILKAKEEGNSIGGTVEVMISGTPVGLGNPFFDSVESKISSIVFSVPAVKGIEFGAGFSITEMNGKEANDEYHLEGEDIRTKTNNNGGITGGISNGMPIIFKVAIKPTSSISIKQNTINIKDMKETELEVHGRHDPCIVHRAVPVLESVAAIAILDLMLLEGEF
ncbi:MAG: chorismate synthase [Andreesenia angusta]|nr:chorismate synthase [Andreesenia angusta]